MAKLYQSWILTLLDTAKIKKDNNSRTEGLIDDVVASVVVAIPQQRFLKAESGSGTKNASRVAPILYVQI